MTSNLDHIKLSEAIFNEYNSAMTRGHREWEREARIGEDYYLGGGKQWDEEDKSLLEAENRPWLEADLLFSVVNTVLGYQTQTRMDLAYKPREAADQRTSDILTKLALFIIDQNKFPWKESQVFADGLIQSRGYYDIRMDFDNNSNGDVRVSVLDPLHVVPDPDANAYDPTEWSKVIVKEWITLDDTRETYGDGPYRRLLRFKDTITQSPWGEDGQGEPSNTFSDQGSYKWHYTDGTGTTYFRVLSKQYYKLTNRQFYVDLSSGDYIEIPKDTPKREINKTAKENNYEVITRLVKRVRWTIVAPNTVLHDDWSPYSRFTIIPYFPYFRRGKTASLISNSLRMQDMLNKVLSQLLHVVNTTANSGWIVAEDSLSNMDIDELEGRGSETGLVLAYRPGREKPEKIQSNPVPAGLKDLTTTAVELIRLITGVSETFQGGKGPEVSGVAIQSRVQQSAVQLATPIDNLFRTRNLVGEFLLELMQNFYTQERIFLVSSPGDAPIDTEIDEQEEITINQQLEDGEIINDLTVGKYDIVIADVPTAITFQNAQFAQALEMRKFGINIPDDEMVMMSTLARKQEIAKKVRGDLSEEQQRIQEETQRLQLENLQLENEKLKAEAADKNMKSVKTAVDAGVAITQNPNAGLIADTLIEDQEANNRVPLGQPLEPEMPLEDEQLIA